MNRRIFTVRPEDRRARREYVYVLDAINQGRGVNELLAINDHEFLVLERDNRTQGPDAAEREPRPNLKRIYRIDLNKAGLTDVSDVDSLPATAPSSGDIVPVTKTLFLDMLDPDYKVDADAHDQGRDRREDRGARLGPRPSRRPARALCRQRQRPYPGLPTQIYAFAIDGSASGANISYRPQRIPGPMFPPGQVRRSSRTSNVPVRTPGYGLRAPGLRSSGLRGSGVRSSGSGVTRPSSAKVA